MWRKINVAFKEIYLKILDCTSGRTMAWVISARETIIFADYAKSGAAKRIACFTPMTGVLWPLWIFLTLISSSLSIFG